MRVLLIAILLASLNGGQQPAERIVSLTFEHGPASGSPRTVLDTASGLYTQDMVCDRPVTVPMTLADEDYARILAAAEAADFFAPPLGPAPLPADPAKVCHAVPCFKWHVEIRTNLRSNSLSWDDCHCNVGPDGERGRRVATAIDAAIRANPTFATLPKPRCSYL